MTFRWRTFGIALAAATVTLTVVWSSWCPPFYLTNDDVTIRKAVEGRTVPGATPTGFALLTHAAFGWAIVAMQRVLPSISWWDIALTGLLLWALGVLLALVWDALGSDWLARTTTVAVVVFAMASVFASLQFTISSTLAGGAAAMLAIRELGAARPRRSVLIMACLLFAAALLMRRMGGAAGAVIAIGLSVPVMRTRRWWWAHILGIVAIVAVLFLAIQYSDGVMYAANREWAEYYRYNWMVGLIGEWGSDLSTAYERQIRESVGWSANDWLMLMNSWGVDPVVHGLKNLGRAYQTQTAIASQVGTLSWLFGRAMQLSMDDAWTLFLSSAPAAFAIGAMTAAYATRRACVGVIGVTVLFLMSCLAIEVTFEKLPWRLLGGLEVLFVAAALMTVGVYRRGRAASPVLAILSLGTIVAMTIPVLAAEVRESGSRLNRSQELDVEIAQLQRLSPSLVIFYGSRFPREFWWRPFHSPPADIPVVALGWNNQNPQLHRFLSATGREPLLRALCTDPSILIVADRDPLDLVTTYMDEHFNTTVTWTQVYDGSFPLWRCAAIKGESSRPTSGR
jgi:hypothetical protein